MLFLKDLSGLGQATAYIRPLQRDLDSTPVSEVRFLHILLMSTRPLCVLRELTQGSL